jgi:hypothetical protein
MCFPELHVYQKIQEMSTVYCEFCEDCHKGSISTLGILMLTMKLNFLQEFHTWKKCSCVSIANSSRARTVMTPMNEATSGT